MSQTVNKITVKNKNPGTISTGANTVIELNGEPIKYCTFFKMEVKPKSLAKVTIEMYADVEFSGDVELSKREINDNTITINGAVYTLSRLEPVIVK